jgi:hypothetical protein
MRPTSWIEVVATTAVKFGIPRLLFVLLSASVMLAQGSPVPQIANPLVPTAVAPGSAGFTLTVNGTGFVSASTVYWNGSPRSTVFVSAAQLTAAISAGDVAAATSGSVTVHNPGGTVSNAAVFLVTSPVALLAFGAAQINSYGGDVLSADFDGDGKPDVLVNLRTAVLVATGNGDGSFQPPAQYSLAGNGQGTGSATILGDFNNDGFPDVAFPSYTPLAVQIMLNSGTATFAPAPAVSVSTANAIATADVNGDGKLDLIFTASLSVGVALGNGDGTFQSPTYLPLPQDSFWVTVGDFNRDGIPDIAAGISDYGGISILLGRGDGTFEPQVGYDNGHQTFYLTAADLNGDGYPDLIGSDINSNSFFVLLNAGDGTFLPSVNYHGPQGTVEFAGIAAGDMNGDGINDLVLQAASLCSNNCIEVFFGNGDGTLQPATLFGTRQDIGGGQEGQISLADFNHDGKLDVGTPTIGGPFLMLQSKAPEPTIAPGSLSFAPQAVGSESPNKTLTLYQPGDTAISISSITASGDFISDGGCVGFVLNPGNNYCYTGVFFLPTTTGLRTGSLTITSSGGTQYVTLTGTGTPAIDISISPSSLSFATQGLNSTSLNMNITLTNTGSQTLNLNSITLSGANTGDFLVTNLCGSTLSVGASCTVQVAFRPSTSGLRTASLNIADNAANSPQTVTLSGIGNALHISTNLLDFGNVTVGTSSSLTLTLRNLGSTRSILVSQIKFLSNAADYSQTNDCNGSIAPRSNCTMTVTFTPQTQGQLNSVLTFSSNGTGKQATSSINLRGRGE